jgi:hypothetical protein
VLPRLIVLPFMIPPLVMCSSHDFNTLVQRAASLQREGRDFSYLQGRTIGGTCPSAT